MADLGNHKRSIFLFFSLLLFLLANPIFGLANKRVLYVSSYDPTFPTYDQQIAGLRSVMSADSIVMNVEYMDTKRFETPTNSRLFHDYLSYKLKSCLPYDLVVVGDDAAFNFAIHYQQELFYQVPIVFLGVNNLDAVELQKNNPWVTGVVEKVPMESTLALMHRIYPHASSLYVITDGTISGISDLKSFYNQASKFDGLALKTLMLEDLSFQELAFALQKIPSDIPVLLLSAYQDKNGLALSFYESLHLITKNLKAPLFHLWSHGIGQGILGGDVISHYDQGRYAGKIALQIFEGKSPNSIPVKDHISSQYMFDYEKLNQFHISTTKLPLNSIIIHEPVSFFEVHQSVILQGGILLLVMGCFLILLFFKCRQLKSISKEYLLQKEKAETADHFKSAFVMNMSHEIRTPLNSIVGFASMLTQNDVTPEDKKMYLEIVKENNELLLRLIDEVLNVSQVESGACVFVQEAVDMVSLMKNLELIIRDQIRIKGLLFVFEESYEICNVEIDRTRLMQVLMNLLDNAMKFTHVGKIEISYQADTEGLSFQVKDTGMGIPIEKQALIFNRFEKGDEFIPGVGLGLYLCKMLVEAAGGTIGFKSQVGKGSCFWFNVPCKVNGVIPKIKEFVM